MITITLSPAAPLALSLALPLVGRVPAGFPSPATEALQDTITLTEYLIEHPSTSSLYTVKDDALDGQGIFRDDRVIIECKAAIASDIVLAEADGDLVLRVLKRDRTEYYLAAAHPDYPVIDQTGETRILGVVVALARKCGAWQ